MVHFVYSNLACMLVKTTSYTSEAPRAFLSNCWSCKIHAEC